MYHLKCTYKIGLIYLLYIFKDSLIDDSTPLYIAGWGIKRYFCMTDGDGPSKYSVSHSILFLHYILFIKFSENGFKNNKTIISQRILLFSL